MKKVLRVLFPLIILCGVLGIAGNEAACQPISEAQVLSDLSPVGSCVLQGELSAAVDAISDPILLVTSLLQCTGATVAAIIKIAQQALDNPPPTVLADAGTGVSLSVRTARLQKVLVAAKAYAATHDGG